MTSIVPVEIIPELLRMAILQIPLTPQIAASLNVPLDIAQKGYSLVLSAFQEVGRAAKYADPLSRFLDPIRIESAVRTTPFGNEQIYEAITDGIKSIELTSIKQITEELTSDKIDSLVYAQEEVASASKDMMRIVEEKTRLSSTGDKERIGAELYLNELIKNFIANYGDNINPVIRSMVENARGMLKGVQPETQSEVNKQEDFIRSLGTNVDIQIDMYGNPGAGKWTTGKITNVKPVNGVFEITVEYINPFTGKQCSDTFETELDEDFNWIRPGVLETIPRMPNSVTIPAKNHSMYYMAKAGQTVIPDYEGPILTLAERGIRTSTTRSYPLGRPGDIITFEGRPTRYIITGTHQITEEDMRDPSFIERLSQTEGWTTETILGQFKNQIKPGAWITYYRKI